MVPGLEKSVSDAIVPGLQTISSGIVAAGTSLTTNLGTNLLGKFASPLFSRNDTEVSPYPTFAIWCNQQNRKAGFNIINSDFQSIAANAMPGFIAGYASPEHSHMPNWYEEYRNWTYTGSYNSSESVTTYSGGSTVGQSADSHWMYRPCLHGGNSGNWMNRPYETGNFQTRCGSIIGVSGVRQRVSHWSDQAIFQIRPRGANNGYYDYIDLNNAAIATWAGRNNRGMSSYNDRTKMLAIAESTTTGNNIRLHVWRNTSLSLNNFNHKSGILRKFLSEAKAAGPSLSGGVLGAEKSYSFYDFTWAQSGSTRNEPAYHMKLVMGDNGIVGFGRFNHDSNHQRYGYWIVTSTGSAGNSGTGNFTDTEINLANTTSYGIDQGEHFGQRHNITWDNNWMAIYSPYYYYESGINCHIIDTKDPTKLFYWRNATSAGGMGMVPYKADKFITIRTNSNADGPGPYLFLVDPSSAAKNFRRPDGSTLSYGGDLQPYNQHLAHYQFEMLAGSTTYPHIVSMPHWSNP